ncbi:protein O-mannose kinase-like [Uloborus diversus]|uniref:protein O-mannose kinase-like n=1 Tax=Uloborus diversus TaxID=327109 RepID=UPI002408F30F|nr:protein O-mannose kinase-like [Uloborus diversus]
MKKTFFSLISILLAFLFLQTKNGNHKDSSVWECEEDFVRNASVCKLKCPYGSFALPGMLSCHPWLSCETELVIISVISLSVVKMVYLTKWQNYEVVLSVLSSKIYKDDFEQNLFMLKSLSGNSFVIQLLGFCDNMIITEYHPLGNALNTHYHFSHYLKPYDSIQTRLKLCINYVAIIELLHSSPVGVRVMCDSNTLEKTLSQYLLKTSLELVVNDLDATPEVNNITKRGIHCGKNAPLGDLVAPEQKWLNINQKFNLSNMPLYDEKTDIWKIPNICNWFLGESSDADIVKYQLFKINQLCKNIKPAERPSASNIKEAYEKIYAKQFQQKSL